jgi:hypothetical protein
VVFVAGQPGFDAFGAVDLWIAPTQPMGSSRIAAGSGALIDVEILTEQRLLFLWLSGRGERVSADFESRCYNGSGLGCGSALALRIREHYGEIWQENGSGEEHPHHPSLNENSEDDANHTNDLRD